MMDEKLVESAAPRDALRASSARKRVAISQ